ncbi:MAG: hypothetical protein RLZZ563_1868 [Pseudomonadota bacterium]
MTDEVWSRDEVQSPCIKLCTIHPAERICVGCYRSIDEISAWSRLSPDARRSIMAELPSRAPRLAKRRGGRMGRVRG